MSQIVQVANRKNMLPISAALSSGKAGSNGAGGSPMESSIDAMLCCCFPLGRL